MVDFSNKEFDVKAAAERGAWLQLVHPVTGKELGDEDEKGNLIRPCRIQLQGADSMAYEQSVAKTVAMRQRETPPTRRGRVNPRQIMDTADRNRGFQVDELVSITLNWENIEVDGEPFPFNHENAVRLYTDHPWIREQAIEFFTDRANFAGNA